MLETGPDLLGFIPIVEQKVPRVKSHELKIFHSADLGASWTEITPSYKSDDWVIPSGINVWAAGETLFASSAEYQYRSTDNGQTWTELAGDTDMFMINRLPAVVVNETTFYKAGPFGIFRTTDGGKSWGLLIDGMVGTRLQDMVAFNNKLYGYTGFEVYQSTDAGVSWKKISTAEMVFMKGYTITAELLKPNKAHFQTFFSTNLVVDNNNLYLISPKDNNLRISRLFTDDNRRSPVQSIPTPDNEAVFRKLGTGSAEAKKTHLSEGSEKEHHSTVSIVPPPIRGKEATARMVVVRNDVFYAEHEGTLFMWRLGDPEWTNMGLTNIDGDFTVELKLAVSGETVYVGKRDGKLFQSLDGGNSWRDVTPSLPLHFADFKEITFVGSTVYVATDKGVLSSDTGVHWRVLTDSSGQHPIIDRFAVDGPTIYGAGDIGVYRLDIGKQWKQVSSEALGETVVLAVINDKLYSAIEDRGIFHISLAEE